jgi:transcriptional regulator with XRE-family HTH domain
MRGLGSNLRRARQTRGLSLERLSRASGVSRAMISQVELGKSTPTINVLWRMAQALGVPLATLVNEGATARCVLLRADVAKVLTSRDGGFSSRALFRGDGPGAIEFNELTLRGGSTESADSRPPGSTETLVVARGTLTVAFRGERYCLQTGDAIFFDADSPHEYVNDGPEDARAYVVTSNSAADHRSIRS